jgi:hypothetical protein
MIAETIAQFECGKSYQISGSFCCDEMKRVNGLIYLQTFFTSSCHILISPNHPN